MVLSPSQAARIIGQEFKGTVVTVLNYGLLVNIGDLIGLVHIKDLSHSRSGQHTTFYRKGDKIDVVVTRINTKNGKIALSHNILLENTVEIELNKYNKGDIVTGLLINPNTVEISNEIIGIIPQRYKHNLEVNKLHNFVILAKKNYKLILIFHTYAQKTD